MIRSRGGEVEMKRSLLALTISFVVLVLFQNCAGQKNLSDSPTVTCTPKNQPCLNYSFSMQKASSSSGGMTVRLRGSSSEGVSDTAEFSSVCNQKGTTEALCPFDTKVTGVIRSNLSQNGDGRSLQITFTTDELSAGMTSGTLYGKAHAFVEKGEAVDDFSAESGDSRDEDGEEPVR